MELDSISLNNTLPEVFADTREAHSDSDVWLRFFTFERGKRYLVSAASGAGKSSLCAFLYGYRQDYSGTILFNSTDIRTLTPGDWNAIRRESLAWLPQDMRLFPSLTVMENVMLKATLSGMKTEADVRRMLDSVGLDGYADRPARLLSIGQQQRVAAVRALCQPFHFLLLDEPVSHLDEASNESLAALIDMEASSQGAGVIVTSVGNPLRLEPDFRLFL